MKLRFRWEKTCRIKDGKEYWETQHVLKTEDSDVPMPSGCVVAYVAVGGVEPLWKEGFPNTPFVFVQHAIVIDNSKNEPCELEYCAREWLENDVKNDIGKAWREAMKGRQQQDDAEADNLLAERNHEYSASRGKC